MTPRGKSKFSGCKCIKEYYDNKSESQKILPYKQYVEVIRLVNKKAMEAILNGETIDIGWGGIMKIVKRKNSKGRRVVDFKATKEQGMTMFHLNEHTGQFYYRFYWRKGRIKNISAYSFIATRTNKRDLAAKIKTEKADYFEI